MYVCMYFYTILLAVLPDLEFPYFRIGYSLTLYMCMFFHSLSLTHSTPPSFSFRGSATRRFEQDVEQARPTDTSEEEMQLKLALQLSKQQAEEEEKLK